MTTDNRTNGPTEAQVRAAHRAYYDADPDGGYMQAMKAALLAAATTPQPVIDEDALAEVIGRVTDLWDEPLDEVHDIPQIARAVAAWLKDGAKR